MVSERMAASRVAEEKARQEIVRVCQLLWQRGYVSASDGNVSVRLGPDRLLTTPSGVSKGFLGSGQLVVTDLSGELLSDQTEEAKGLRPSSELRMHCEAYRQRPDIGAVVHAHPPITTACTVAGFSLEACVLPEVVLTLGAIPTARYATPGTAQVAESIRELIREFDALALERHGAVTVGATAFEAYLRLEKVEHTALIVQAAYQLGGVLPLPAEEVQRLRAMRRRMRGLPVEGDDEGCLLSVGDEDLRGVVHGPEQALAERIAQAVLHELRKPGP